MPVLSATLQYVISTSLSFFLRDRGKEIEYDNSILKNVLESQQSDNGQDQANDGHDHSN